MATAPPPAQSGRDRLREHLSDPLYQTGYFLILGTGVTGLLGIAFWVLAAQTYPARVVGLNSAAISALTLVSGVCTLGLSTVLVRYLPVAGASTRTFVVRSYLVTVVLSLVLGAAAALTSSAWSSKLGFLDSDGWLIGFTLATAATTVFTLQDGVLTGLRSARWIPLENSLYSLAKLAVLLALVGVPGSGLFIAWNAPLPAAILLINLLVFRRLIPAHPSHHSLDRRKLIGMATGNLAGWLFGLAATLYLPILVANLSSAVETAYFFIPWTICLALQLVAVNIMISLTVEAAVDMAQLRQLTRRALATSMRLVVPLAALTAIAAPWMLIAFGQAYADAGASLLRLLAAGMIPNVIVALGVSVARIQHRGRAMAVVEGSLAVLVIGLSAILLPPMGITGVGVAWTVSQTVIALALLGTILRPLLLPQRWAGNAGRREPSLG
ncbi:MAG: hypothetical protein AABM29_02295 [Actinomycetota bacterium]